VTIGLCHTKSDVVLAYLMVQLMMLMILMMLQVSTAWLLQFGRDPSRRHGASRHVLVLAVLDAMVVDVAGAVVVLGLAHVRGAVIATVTVTTTCSTTLMLMVAVPVKVVMQAQAHLEYTLHILHQQLRMPLHQQHHQPYQPPAGPAGPACHMPMSSLTDTMWMRIPRMMMKTGCVISTRSTLQTARPKSELAHLPCLTRTHSCCPPLAASCL
jgi:hypothetical protein